MNLKINKSKLFLRLVLILIISIIGLSFVDYVSLGMANVLILLLGFTFGVSFFGILIVFIYIVYEVVNTEE